MACQNGAHISHTTVADFKGILLTILWSLWPFGKYRLTNLGNVLQQFAKSVSKRISETRSNEQIFKESIPIYEEALKKSGFHEKLEYIREEVDKHGKEEKKRRKRKTIWFNPPYSNNVKSNVGKQFLKLVRRHYPKGHKLNKIFNKNTLKVSYSCMRNMSSILTSHNKKILADNERKYECNCK